MKLAALCPEPLPSVPDRVKLPDEVLIGPGAAQNLREVVAGHIGSGALVVSDLDTAKAASNAGLDIDTIAPKVSRHSLGERPHARDTLGQSVAERIRASAGTVDGVVAIGSGTINDISKFAAAEVNCPYVVLATAASMNGYASGIAAMIVDGLKKTVPARPARAVVIDTDILVAAPRELGQAGLGDLISKPVSDTDWWLGDQLEGSGYSELPGRIVDHAVSIARDHASGLRSGTPEAYEALARALVLSGVAMVVAGSSSPASGGEHLISHLWDMEALANRQETRLHGAQVGVATCISAALFRHLIRFKHPKLAAPLPWASEAVRLQREHGRLAPVILPQAQLKHARAAARVDALRDRWPEIRDALAARRLPTPKEIHSVLAEAGAPRTLKALGMSRVDGARTLRLARDIRDRVTVLDVAFELGLLPSGLDEVLASARV